MNKVGQSNRLFLNRELYPGDQRKICEYVIQNELEGYLTMNRYQKRQFLFNYQSAVCYYSLGVILL